MVVTDDSDATVADGEPFVGVSDGEVEGKVVVEGAVGGCVGEIKLREKGISDCDCRVSGKNDNPDQKYA